MRAQRARDAPTPSWHEDAPADWLAWAPESFAGQRAAMMEALRERLERLTGTLGRAAVDRALSAMAQVEREKFICPWIEDIAYLPMPHDIGLGQTISHPEMVAVLAAAADPRGGDVLDVGTGSGYQAAVLSGMARHVTSVEILEPHARFSGERLRRLGFANIDVMAGDGAALGLFEEERFDAIVVAAGAREVPAALCSALRIGGRLVMPIGPMQGDEHLVLTERQSSREFRHSRLCPTRFVPLTGRFGRSPMECLQG
ncbi:protein-L-isoaspartate O-methyltransferase family protein [Novosphingobium rosa]|uniref:protein-L-isoaspartate O-methyltransferase family protein n=1 Tax=Novosphingobium rosa TaxID=76978 RepID=UPI00082AC31B|nr:protein-L-isoaspartate O-methyltransferase [Novosphingobium rosa]